MDVKRHHSQCGHASSPKQGIFKEGIRVMPMVGRTLRTKGPRRKEHGMASQSE